jgi:hypothetical protein
MTIKQYENIKKQIESAKKEVQRLEINKENIEKSWKTDGIDTIGVAKEKVDKLDIEIEKLEKKENVLAKQLEENFDWDKE